MKSTERVANKLKKATHKLALNISIHGIKRIVIAETFVAKLAWILMIIASSVYGIINTVRTFNEYYQYQVVTNVERISPKNITFPAVTVCFPSVLIRNHFVNSSSNEEFKREVLIDFDLQPFVKEANFFNSASMKIPVINNLVFFNDTKMNSKCVKFNEAGLVKAENAFGHFHLKIANTTRSREHNESNSSQSVVMDHLAMKNYIVYVADNYLNSFLNQGPLFLDTGTIETITTDKTTTERKLGQPYNPCNQSLPREYRRDNCIEECINQVIGEKRNCSIPSRYEIPGLPRCIPFDKYVANKSEIELIKKTAHFGTHFEKPRTLAMEFFKECESKCPQECELTKYSFPMVAQKINTVYGDTELSVKLYDFSSLEITQIPKITFSNFISNIGGTWSMFIGIKFLIIFELFEFFIDLCYVLFIFPIK